MLVRATSASTSAGATLGDGAGAATAAEAVAAGSRSAARSAGIATATSSSTNAAAMLRRTSDLLRSRRDAARPVRPVYGRGAGPGCVGEQMYRIDVRRQERSG